MQVDRAWIPSLGSWWMLGEELIPEMPKMLLKRDSSANSIKDSLG